MQDADREKRLAAEAAAELVPDGARVGLGNVGQTASRTNTKILAGESNYTELGVELGVLGAVLWTAWGLGLLTGLVRCGAAAAGAVFAAILVLAIQTDVIGDPWVAYCVWALGGLQLRVGLRRASQAAPGRRFASSPSAPAQPEPPGSTSAA